MSVFDYLRSILAEITINERLNKVDLKRELYKVMPDNKINDDVVGAIEALLFEIEIFADTLVQGDTIRFYRS
ncbi:MAG: hypothetical protein U5K75_02175 [Ahrensia sp.]|nr:hypothetical protein [Ahrensia sp.]